MLDSKYFQQEQEIAVLAASLKKRHQSSDFLGLLQGQFQQRKVLIQDVETAKAQLNRWAKEIGQLKAQKNEEQAQVIMQQVAALKQKIEQKEVLLKQLEEQIEQTQLMIPNLLDSSVPEGATEAQNLEVKRWGEVPSFTFPVSDHVTVAERLGLLDMQAAGLMTGSRFTVLKGALARLERALGQYMLDVQLSKGYTEVSVPFLVHEKSLVGTGQLPKFKEDLFKVENFPWYLIPTSEVPLTNLKREQLFAEAELPLKHTALTPCFRSEAGSYGKDTRGLIRMHQFFKVEMVQITSPEQSSQAQEEMMEGASYILQQLGLAHRVIVLCGGDTGFGATKTYDLEVWLPSQQCYREISSVSNCGDFQARRAGIRFRSAQTQKPQFAHTLNGSGLAVGRTLVAILENYQQADGSVLIPEVLRPYMGNLISIKPQ